MPLALSAAGALAAVVAVVLVLSFTGGPTAPSVADAAELALQPVTGPAPARTANGTRLAADVQGLAFPDYAQTFGWQAVGVRQGTLAGRDATVVYYEKGDRQIAYAIVAGPALARPPGGQTTTVAGVPFQTLSVQGKPAVTWRRLGHTCVVIGGAAQSELLTLASWRGGGVQGY